MIPSKIKIKILALRRIFAALGTKGLTQSGYDCPQYNKQSSQEKCLEYCINIPPLDKLGKYSKWRAFSGCGCSLGLRWLSWWLGSCMYILHPLPLLRSFVPPIYLHKEDIITNNKIIIRSSPSHVFYKTFDFNWHEVINLCCYLRKNANKDVPFVLECTIMIKMHRFSEHPFSIAIYQTLLFCAMLPQIWFCSLHPKKTESCHPFLVLEELLWHRLLQTFSYLWHRLLQTFSYLWHRLLQTFSYPC